ncbi:glycosyltransferase [Bacillus massilinigeriensis]|uniref:glycosyltransferase n=1 Tax=Bacillus mediterraneensis TaxID=1805474 RepID=UPI0008F8B4CC|nr:glycosyltransferase [Bacillus mediterraneensis]
MKILHLNAGNETGGGMVHILSLLKGIDSEELILGLFEDGVFAEKARAQGIRTVTFSQSSRYDLTLLSKLKRFIKEEKIDIIHTHGARANLFGFFARMMTGVTWATTVHSDPRNDFLGRGLAGKMFTGLNMAVLKKADHYFAVSDRFKDMLREFGIARERITVIYNGIDFQFVTKSQILREDLKLSAEEFVLLMVARFDPVKRHELAIEALETVRKVSKEKVRLLLVGEGTERKRLEDLVMAKNLNSHILFLGHQDEVAPFFKLADATLLTSRTESFPLVLLESSREGTPAITTDVGGVREMIPDPEHGFIVDGTSQAIAAAIMEAARLKARGELKEMGEKFRKHTSERFSVQSFADSVYNAYKLFVN